MANLLKVGCASLRSVASSGGRFRLTPVNAAGTRILRHFEHVCELHRHAQVTWEAEVYKSRGGTKNKMGIPMMLKNLEEARPAGLETRTQMVKTSTSGPTQRSLLVVGEWECCEKASEVFSIQTEALDWAQNRGFACLPHISYVSTLLEG